MLLGWHNIAASVCPLWFKSYCTQRNKLRIGSRSRTKEAVLLLFAHLCNVSERTRCVNHRELFTALLGLDQYHNIIYASDLRAQIRSIKEDQPTIISRGCRIISIISISPQKINLFLSECSFRLAYQLREAQVVSLLISSSVEEPDRKGGDAGLQARAESEAQG